MLKWSVYLDFIYNFCIAIICYIIDKDKTSYLIILKYISKTNKIKHSLSGHIELYIALNDIYSAKSSSILGILVIIINSTYHKSL